MLSLQELQLADQRAFKIDRNPFSANLILPQNPTNQAVNYEANYAKHPSQPKRNIGIEAFRYNKVVEIDYLHTEFSFASEIFNIIQRKIEELTKKQYSSKEKQNLEPVILGKLKGVLNALNLLTVLPAKKELVFALTNPYIAGIDTVITEYFPSDSVPNSKDTKLNIIGCLADLIAQNFRFSNPRYNDDLLSSVATVKNKLQAVKEGQSNFVARNLAQGVKQEICASMPNITVWNSVLSSPERIYEFISSFYLALTGNYGNVNANRNNSFLYFGISGTVQATLNNYPFLVSELPFVFTQILENLWLTTILPVLEKQNVHTTEIRKIQANFQQLHNYFAIQLQRSKQPTIEKLGNKLDGLRNYLTK